MNVEANPGDNIQSKIAYVAGTGGGEVRLNPGVYSFTSPLTVSSNVSLVGSGRYCTRLEKLFIGDFISLQDATSIRHLEIVPSNTNPDYAQGVGITITEGHGFQFMESTSVSGFADPCLRFSANSGSGFVAVACTFFTAATPGEGGAVQIVGSDINAVPRQFHGCTGNGCTLFDFGGAKDLFVSGGYTNGLRFPTDQSALVLCTNMRIGAAGGNVTVRGHEHCFSSCVFALGVELDETSINCSRESCVAPFISDKGSGNRFTVIQAFDDITWTAETTDPNPTSAAIVAFAEHIGTKAIVTLNLTIVNAKAGLGVGEWYFSLPFDEKIYATYAGSAIAFDASTGRRYVGTALTFPTQKKLRVFFNDSTSPMSGTSPMLWEDGDTLQIQLMYTTK